ncbi:MAG: polysaccharide biosynthesis C-terminal domain-containing protein, partial [Candidatus Limnocylindria bacterium]
LDLLAQSFNAAWVPFFYRYGSTRLGPGIHREMTTLVVAAFAALGAALALNATLIVGVIAAPEYGPAADIIPILVLAFVAHVFYITVVTVLFHERQTGILPLITAGSAAANVAVNLALIPLIGIFGAAWATLAAFSVMAIATYLAARRVYPVDLAWPRLGLLFIIPIAAAGFASTRPGALTVPDVALNLALSVAVLSAAAAIGLTPFRSLRTLTRTVASEEPAPTR